MQGTPQFSDGESETGRLARRIDWHATPLGTMEAWPQSLKTSLSICLDCRFPIILWWGREMVVLYNDDYIPILGKKHPAAFGGKGRDVWADVWPVIGPMLESVMTTGKAVKADDLRLIMNRNGYEEETYFSFSYSPITDESGGIGGIFTPVIETTEKVIGHRRIETLRLLGNQPRATDLPAACRAFADVLAGARADVTFGLIYMLDEELSRADLVASFGVEGCADIAPAQIALADQAARWPLAGAIASGGMQVVSGLENRFELVPDGVWASPVQQAILAPIALPGSDHPVAVLVAGVSPHRALDAAYLSFYNLLADQLQASVSEAVAYEAERKRVEALAQIDRAKTIFFSNVSHEFRTPLTLMLGPIEELMADPGLPRPAHRQLAILQRNGIRLLKLVNALLDFSRIEAGRMRAVFEPVDLAAYTAELASVFRSAIEKAGMALEVQCDALRQPVYVDRSMWEKIVLNLLSNAFKFTFEGAISVSVFESEGNAVLSVTDSGVGIEPDQLARVFERFHRIEGARSRSHEGTGIGLALVRDLVSLHGGDIRIESMPGQGTRLQIRLPFGRSHLPPDQVSDAAAEGWRITQADAYVVEAELWLAGESGMAASPLHGEDDGAAAGSPQGDIFVVDDNADMRDYVARLLQPRWRVTTFANGEEVLEAARTRPPDVVLADVMMPVMDGIELLAALRADPSLHDLPVILLSARAGEEARVSGMQAGADDYLVKPFSSRELLARVDALHLRARVRAIEKTQARRMESVFAHAPAAIAMTRGPEHVYELVNRSYLELVGHRDVVGKPIRIALPELAGQGIYELLDEVYRTGEPHIGRSLKVDVMKGKPPVLQECFFDFVYQPMHDERGRIEGIAVVAFDVTELSRARQTAELASRTKDEFLAMLGHELRNPLSPIMTALELMKLRGVEGAEKERAIIERQAYHLLGLVDDLLDVARVARGKIKLRKKRVELGEIIARAIETASPLLDEKQHTLHIDVPEQGLAVYVDSDRFAQVVANLLTNAAKYTDNGGTISVRGRREDAGIVVEVEDNGCGIAADMLPHVFEMFVQGRQNLARSPGGLGLGLTIVRNLTELHGGSVSVQSNGPGRGSRFTACLPAADMLASETAEELAASTPNEEAPAREVLTALVVDDNADAGRMLASLISDFGHRAMLAYDGPSALECLARHTPELAILDIGLPGMDGYELARRIRAMPGKEKPLLVALTGYGQVSDRTRALEAGFDLHVVKPLNLPRLKELLEEVDARKRGQPGNCALSQPGGGTEVRQ